MVKWLKRLVGDREQRDQLREQWGQVREQWGQLRGQWSAAGLVKAPRVLKPMDERVVDAFDDETRDKLGLKYLEVALERWSEITSTVRRTLTLMVVLVASFVLLADATTAEFALGPLKLSNVSTVLTIVPAIVSFLLYEFAVLQRAAHMYRHVVKALVMHLYPSVAANDLELLLAPATATLWGHHQWPAVREAAPGRSGTVLLGLNAGFGLLIMMIGPVAFLAYAFVHLYGDAHANAVAVTAGLLFTCFNVLRAILFSVDTNRTQEELKAGR